MYIQNNIWNNLTFDSPSATIRIWESIDSENFFFENNIISNINTKLDIDTTSNHLLDLSSASETVSIINNTFEDITFDDRYSASLLRISTFLYCIQNVL